MISKYTFFKLVILKECPVCNGRVVNMGNGVYKCTKCGMTFVLGNVEEKMVELLKEDHGQ